MEHWLLNLRIWDMSVEYQDDRWRQYSIQKQNLKNSNRSKLTSKIQRNFSDSVIQNDHRITRKFTRWRNTHDEYVLQ